MTVKLDAMKDLLSLTIPGADGSPMKVETPPGIPSGISIGKLATNFLGLAMVVGILLSFFYLVYGGWFWLQSKGDKEKLDKARRIIINSIIGLIVMSLALVIVNIIAQALDVKSAVNP